MFSNKSLEIVHFKMNSAFAFAILHVIKISTLSWESAGATRLFLQWPPTCLHQQGKTPNMSSISCSWNCWEVWCWDHHDRENPSVVYYSSSPRKISNNCYHPWGCDTMWRKIKNRNTWSLASQLVEDPLTQRLTTIRKKEHQIIEEDSWYYINIVSPTYNDNKGDIHAVGKYKIEKWFEDFVVILFGGDDWCDTWCVHAIQRSVIW